MEVILRTQGAAASGHCSLSRHPNGTNLNYVRFVI